MPVCPNCHKPMKKKAHLSISYAIEKAIEDAICYSYGSKGAPDQWACVSMSPNPEYRRWEDRCSQYKKQGKEPPPAPMKMLPCKNHWQLKGNPMDPSPKKKNPKTFFLQDETTGIVFKVPSIF